MSKVKVWYIQNYTLIINLRCFDTPSACGGVVHYKLDCGVVFGGDGIDWVTSMDSTSDGGILLAGITTSFGADGKDVWILKLDQDDKEEWDALYGGEKTRDSHLISPFNFIECVPAAAAKKTSEKLGQKRVQAR